MKELKIKSNFYYSLEGFRGISVLMVLISHFLIILHFPRFIFLNLGYLGVNFFFVLSGFLISEILIKEIESGSNFSKILKNFYIKRTLRIFPIYYLSIFSLSIFNIENTRELLPWTLTYSTNISSVWFGKNAQIIGHFWSLCVEEQFYLFWPLLLMLFRRNLKYLFISTITLSIIAKFLYLLFDGPNIQDFIHDSTPAALDALSFGALLAYLKKNNIIILCFLGKISYGIYVYHLIIYYLLIPYYNLFWGEIKDSLGIFGYQNWFFPFLFFSTISIIVAALSFYFIEKPLLKLKKRFS